MTITITTSNVNGIRAAKRKGIEEWAGRNTPDVWCMQEVRAPQNEIDPIFDEFGFEYSTAGRISDQSELHRMNEICRIKGRAGVGLLSALPVVDKRYGLPGLEDDVDSGRWIEADMQTPQGYVITVVCVYVHAGNTDDPEKMKQKYRFLDTMLIRMEQLRDEAAHGGKQAVLCGDFNIGKFSFEPPQFHLKLFDLFLRIVQFRILGEIHPQTTTHHVPCAPALGIIQRFQNFIERVQGSLSGVDGLQQFPFLNFQRGNAAFAFRNLLCGRVGRDFDTFDLFGKSSLILPFAIGQPCQPILNLC